MRGIRKNGEHCHLKSYVATKDAASILEVRVHADVRVCADMCVCVCVCVFVCVCLRARSGLGVRRGEQGEGLC